MTLALSLALGLVVAVFGLLELAQLSLPRRIAGALTLAVVVSGSAWVSLRVLLPGAPVAAADLAAHETLHVPASGTPVVLLAKGQLPEAESAYVHYELLARADNGVVSHFAGDLNRHVEKRRVTRKTSGPVQVQHVENLHAVPHETAGHAVDVTVEKVDGPLVGALHLEAFRAPPGERGILLGALASLIAAAAVDASEKRTRLSLAVASAGVFAVLLPISTRPDSSMGAVLMLAVLGALGGLLVGGAARAVGQRFVPREEPRERAPVA